MKRLLTTAIFTLTLLVGGVVAVPTAHAQFFDSFGNSYTTQAAATAADAAASTAATAAQAATQTTAADAVVQATSQTPANYKADSTDSQYNTIMIKIMSLFAWLVGVAAIALDYAVFYTVVNMGHYVSSLSAIGVTWRILRDVGNIMLIFGFLAIGISMIVESSWYGGKTKMLPMLLVAAVFLNFSLFFTEAIIDVGNLFATQFYTQINGGVAPSAQSLSLTTVSNEGISNKIMSQLGLQTIYGQAKEQNTQIFAGANPWFIGFMGILLFLVTAFVMFSLAFILIARFVFLIFLIILAPVGFAGLAVPQLAGKARQWWSSLFEQTMTAPVLLLMLYVALAVITDAQFLTGFNQTGTTADWAGSVVGNAPAFAPLLLTFLIAMGLLIAVTVAAKKLGAFGAGWATETAGKLSFGATAFGMRSTAGWGSLVASRAIRSSKIGGTKTGRVLATTFDKGAKASFDVRASRAATVLGKAGFGLAAGEAAKGGYRAREEASVKGHEEYLKSVGGAIEEKYQPSIAAAQLERATVEKATESEIKAAKDVQTAATKEAKSIADEVKRLEKIVNDNRNSGKFGPEQTAAIQSLDLARARVAPAEARVKEAEAKLKAVGAPLEAVVKKEKEVSDALSAQKKEATMAYAENAKGLASWAVYGPGGAKAANKIIKDATKKGKSESEKVLEAFKAAAKKEAEEEAKKAAASVPEAAK